VTLAWYGSKAICRDCTGLTDGVSPCTTTFVMDRFNFEQGSEFSRRREIMGGRRRVVEIGSDNVGKELNEPGGVGMNVASEMSRSSNTVNIRTNPEWKYTSSRLSHC